MSGFPESVALVQISEAAEVAAPAPATVATAFAEKIKAGAASSGDYGRVGRFGRRARCDGAQCEEAEDRGGTQHAARRTCGGGERDAVRARVSVYSWQ